MKFLLNIFFLSTIFAQSTEIDSIETLLQVKKLNLKYFQNEVVRLENDLKNLKRKKALSNVNLGTVEPIFTTITLPGASAMWIDTPLTGSRVALKNINRIKIFPKFYKDTEYIMAEYDGKIGWLSSLFYVYDDLPDSYKNINLKKR